jgi:hypothetical protein
MEIRCASIANIHLAKLLLNQYSAAIGVTQRATPDAITADLSDKDSAKESALCIGYVEAVPGGCVVLCPLPAFTSAASIIQRSRHRTLAARCLGSACREHRGLGLPGQQG